MRDLKIVSIDKLTNRSGNNSRRMKTLQNTGGGVAPESN
jgi:hypothetical protein